MGKKKESPKPRFFCVECHAVFYDVPLSKDGEATECPECESPWIHLLRGNVLVDVDGKPVEVKTDGGNYTFFAV